MAHPAFWPQLGFIPIGDIPPRCLTQNLPPEADATVLLLNCGDPRNILYTLYSDQGNRVAESRAYDITCCEAEPAILARNIVLFTLLVRDDYLRTTSQIWNIFYHLFLDEESNTLLLAQSHKLAKLSADMETWNNSEYSPFIRISSRLTLSELNRVWTLYAGTGHFTPRQKKQFEEKFYTKMKLLTDQCRDVNVGIGSLAAGPLHMFADELTAMAFVHYRLTGSTAKEPEHMTATIVNPMFAYAGDTDGCLINRWTYPLPAFHLAPAFAPCYAYGQDRPCRTIFDLFRFAKNQFFMWCNAYRQRHEETTGRVLFRFLIGDVLAVCPTLRAYADHGSQTAHERLSPLKLSYVVLGGDYGPSSDHPAPSRFTVIDASNITEDIGMLNILIAASPLLSPDPAATLFTRTLLNHNENPSAISSTLCCEPRTLFVLLNLVPSDYPFGFTTQSNLHDILGERRGKPSIGTLHHDQHLAWRVLSLIQDEPLSSLSVDASQVCGLLYNVFLRMFSDKDATYPSTSESPRSPFVRTLFPYCRRSFALFVHHISTRITTDWDLVITHLIDRVRGADQVLADKIYFQELLCHLHILGLCDERWWFDDPPANPLLPVDRHAGRFRHWKLVPPVVCLVMSIPPQNMGVLNIADKAVKTQLQAQIISNCFRNAFTSVQILFGAVTARGENEDTEIVISEDKLGKHGNSDTIIAFWVPTWVLCLDPLGARVLFGLVATPFNNNLNPQLGPEMSLYDAPLMDISQVYIARRAPITAADQACNLRSPEYNTYPATQTHSLPPGLSATLDDACRRIVSLTQRVDIRKPSVKAALSKPATTVTMEPIGGSSIDLSAGDTFKQRIHFPPVVDTSKATARVARKSSWIEVVLPVPDMDIFSLQNSVLVYREGSVISWNMHYVNLESLPSPDLGKADNPTWLELHTCWMLSDAEESQTTTCPENENALLQLKKSIHNIINHFGDPGHLHSSIFVLMHPGGIDTVIFVTDLLLDLPAHSVVLDAFMLPVERSLLAVVAQRLISLYDSENVVPISVSMEELVLWKRLLPAFAERCRTWTHNVDCEYITGGMIPLSTQKQQVSICNCGRGIITDAFRAKDWAFFAPHVTRVAISPLFALSYMESVGRVFAGVSRERQEYRRFTEKGIGCKKCGKRSPQATLSACSVCKLVKYCGKQCQLADWKEHRAICKRA